ncbi:MAG: rhombosortase [Pseudomonadota bacterium]
MGLVKALDSTDRRRLLLMFVVIFSACGIELLGDTGREWLRYERTGVSAGEWWRLVSGHFTHLGPAHLGLNLAGLVLVALLAGRTLTSAEWLASLAVGMLSVNAGLFLLDPELRWYVGLSGILHGLLVAGLLIGLARRRAESAVLLLVIAGKLVWEQFAGALPGSTLSAGGPVIVNAHLYGAIGGVTAAALISRWRRASL